MEQQRINILNLGFVAGSLIASMILRSDGSYMFTLGASVLALLNIIAARLMK